MVDFYLHKIKHDIITIDDVPPLWKKKVQAELDKLETEEGAE